MPNLFDELCKMSREEFSHYCYEESIHCNCCPFQSVQKENFNDCENAAWEVLAMLKKDRKSVHAEYCDYLKTLEYVEKNNE